MIEDDIQFRNPSLSPDLWPRLSCSAPNQVTLAASNPALDQTPTLFFQGTGQLKAAANLRVLTGEPATEKLVILSNGNVGIGESNPTAAKLVVNGSLKLQQGVAVNEFSNDGNLTDNSDLTIPTEKAVKAYVDTKITQVNTALTTKAAINGAAAQDFQTKNLVVNGALQVTGTVTANKFVGDGSSLANLPTQWVPDSGGSLNYKGGNVGIGNATTPGGRLELQSPWGNWLFLRQERDVEGGGGFHVHNPWGNSTIGQGAAERNRLEIAYRTAAGQDLWGQFVLHGPTGNVGIGISNPQVKLDVGGTTKTQQLKLGDKWTLSGIGDAHANDDWLRLFNQDGSGYFGGLAAGKLWSSTGTVQSSDRLLKREINELTQALDKLLQLRGVSYYWQDRSKGSTPQLGLVAQEVATVFPELVENGADGMKALNYIGLIPVLVQALKEQHHLITQLQAEIHALKNY